MKFAFQADIQELLNLIVHSFYSSKDIFLRELISNASDAIHKQRHYDLQESNLQKEYRIRIAFDTDKKTLTIEDNGIGMDDNDLEKHLSTIAKSGTKDFIKNIQDTKEQIGQFGVGFYSVYLVADSVQILSRKGDSTLWEWTSDGNDVFEIQKAAQQEAFLGHGTCITLHMKEDGMDYLEEQKLRDIVKQHSNWVDYPVELFCCKKQEKEPDSNVEGEESCNDEIEEIDSSSNEKEGVVENVATEEWVWEKINETTPIWWKSAKEIEQGQYNNFYKSCFQDYSDPLFQRHFHTEGNWECHGILYVPPSNPFAQFNDRSKDKRKIKLYVRKVLILDELDKEMLPDWMSFVSGVVDCPDLPLNVSREMLQRTSILRNLKNQIQKQVKNMLSSLKEDETKYAAFYKDYSKHIKLGINEGDSSLLEFLQLEVDGKTSTLAEYTENMREGQSKIYFMGGETDVDHNTMLRSYQNHGYKVILFRDPIDEFMMQRVTKYKDFEFCNISKEHEVPWSDSSEEEVDVENEEAFCKWVHEKLNCADLEKVCKSKSLLQESDDIGYIFSSKYGWTGHMQKLMEAQPMHDPSQNTWMKGKRILELNFRHPHIVRLLELYTYLGSNNEDSSIEENEELPKEEDVVETMKMIFNFVLLSSGFPISNPSLFARQMLSSIQL